MRSMLWEGADVKRLDIDIPEDVLIDPVTGYAINIPLGFQVYAGWQQARPDLYQHILAMRVAEGVVIADDLFSEPTFPKSRVDALQARIDKDGTQAVVDRIRQTKRDNHAD